MAGSNLLTQKELAERGALALLFEYREQIEALYKEYPNLKTAEVEAKRRETMMKKYGTLTPTKAQIDAVKAKGEGAGATATAAAPGAKKSHKKGAGKKAQGALSGVAAAAAMDAATTSAIGAQTGPQAVPEAVPEQAAESDVVEVTEGEPVGAPA